MKYRSFSHFISPTNTEQKLQRNVALLGFEYGFFGIALGFINPNTIIPSFAAQLGIPDILIGVLVTVLLIAWSLPQVFAGALAARSEYKKPFLLRATFIGRPAILLLGIFIALTGAQNMWLTYGMLLLASLIMFGSDAFAAVAWLDIVGGTLPGNKRGGHMAIWQALTAVAILGVAWLVGVILGPQGPVFPNNYALLISCGGAALLISAGFMIFLYEPPIPQDAPKKTIIPWREFGPHLRQLWQHDAKFRRVSLSRIFFSLAALATPFYVLYATTELGWPEGVIGGFIFAQTIGTLVGSLVLGRISNRYGAHWSLRVALLVIATAQLVGVLIVVLGQATQLLQQGMYWWVYFGLGLSEGATVIGYFNYVLEIAPPGQRTIYTGAVNTINSIGLLGPVIGGVILSLSSFGAVFATALGSGLVALWLAMRLPHANGLEMGTTESQG